MSSKLSFFAQNSDRNKPDFFTAHGIPLEPEQVEAREAITGQVYKVMSSGRELYQSPIIRVTLSDPMFVLRIITQQRDEAGRLSPITCLGEIPTVVTNEWYLAVNNEIREFTSQLGWKLADRSDEQIRAALNVLGKSRYQPTDSTNLLRVIRILAIGLAVLLALALFLKFINR